MSKVQSRQCADTYKSLAEANVPIAVSFTVNMVLSLFVCSNFLLSAFFHVQSNVILSVEYSEEHQRNI